MQNLLEKFKSQGNSYVFSLMTMRNEARHMFIKMTDMSIIVYLFHSPIHTLFTTTSTEMVFSNMGKVLGFEWVKVEVQRMAS